MATTLHPSVQAALREVSFSALESDAIIVLPMRLVDGVATYSELDTYAVEDAREAGVDAHYLTRERRYLSEHSAEFMSAIGMALAADLTASAIVKAAKYVRAQIGAAISRGLAKKEADVQLKITAALVEVRPDGSLRIEDVTIEANGDNAVDQFTSALESRLRATKSIEH